MALTDQTDVDVATILSEGRTFPASVRSFFGRRQPLRHRSSLLIAGTIGVLIVSFLALLPARLSSERGLTRQIIEPIFSLGAEHRVAGERTDASRSFAQPGERRLALGEKRGATTRVQLLSQDNARPMGRGHVEFRRGWSHHKNSPAYAGVSTSQASSRYAKLDNHLQSASSGSIGSGASNQPNASAAAPSAKLKLARAERIEALDAIWILRQK